MTRVEMRKARKRQFWVAILILSFCCLLSFVGGIFTHWCICKLNHDNVQKVEISGSTTVYVVTPQVEEVEETKVTEESVPVEEEIEPEPELAEVKSYYSYTEEELDLLSRLIEAEGGAESYDTKLKIGSVVMNRVADSKFPNTIREVIYAKNQFSVTTIKINGVTMIDRPADEESKKAAKEVLDNGTVLPNNVLFFYADGQCDGNWVTTREVYKVCDGTVFAYNYAKGDKV